MMDFDTTQKDPQVKFSIIDIDNQEIDSRTLKLNQLMSRNQTKNK